MNTTEVIHILQDLFNQPLTKNRDRHIVFWYDESAEFSEEIDAINLPNVRVWKFSKHNLFATKYELEINDLTSHFLLYTNDPKPPAQEDWLFNLYKIGNEFTADKLTIFMRKLGIEDDSLRPLFLEYSQFFNSQARFERFSKYPTETFTEEMIDINVLSTLTRSRLNTLDEILRALFTDIVEKRYDTWGKIQKFGNETKFWALIEKYYGYHLEEKSLEALLTFFMMTYTVEQSVDINYPKIWLHYVSPRPTNAIVLMSQWMNHREDQHTFYHLSDFIAERARIETYIQEWTIDELTAFDTFRIFDERIIQFIIDQLTNEVEQFDLYESLILNRRTTYWYDTYQLEYDSLLQVVRFEKLANDLSFIPEQSAINLFMNYKDQLYLFDSYYRKFYLAFDQLDSKEKIRPLRERLENKYTNWFMGELAERWMDSLQVKGNSWFLHDIRKQSDFYNDFVEPYVHKNQRIFVIISDALRYEVAKDLTVTLHNEQRATAQIEAIQGIIPSITSLGMASLLPHKQLTLSEQGDVFVDGQRASSTKQRAAILNNHIAESNAFTFEQLNDMDREDLRAACQGLKVVYIYHNTIDAYGDNSSTEMDVFTGTEEAKRDIHRLIRRLVSNLSATNILITADHGFIYQRDQLEQSHLVHNEEKDPILKERRFIISDNKHTNNDLLAYSLDDILLDETMSYLAMPKGIQRFHTQGAGANYVHGGAMLQEVVLPVITYKNERQKTESNIVRHVDVKITNINRHITNEITYLEFFQINSVDEKILPLRLVAYFVDENDNIISNESLLIADLEANEAFERTWKERFIFKSIVYDRTKTYYLILQYEDGTEYERYPFTIDIL